jgi:hypothetical protein
MLLPLSLLRTEGRKRVQGEVKKERENPMACCLSEAADANSTSCSSVRISRKTKKVRDSQEICVFRFRLFLLTY